MINYRPTKVDTTAVLSYNISGTTDKSNLQCRICDFPGVFSTECPQGPCHANYAAKRNHEKNKTNNNNEKRNEKNQKKHMKDQRIVVIRVLRLVCNKSYKRKRRRLTKRHPGLMVSVLILSALW